MNSSFELIPEGLVLKNDAFIAFFGNKNATLEKLQSFFPKIEFRSVRQTHSDIFIKSSHVHRIGEQQMVDEADAHWTEEKNVGLLIRTADCLPVLCYFPSSRRVAAIHAGWKGVANQIVQKTVRAIQSTPVDFFIGPHIQEKSFEVEMNVKDLILESIPSVSKIEQQSLFSFNESKDRYYLNLSEIVKRQVNENIQDKTQEKLQGSHINSWFSTDLDTKTNLDFHSFRRDRELSGRNLSFICLLT